MSAKGSAGIEISAEARVARARALVVVVVVW
jgi:hypothetical protein